MMTGIAEDLDNSLDPRGAARPGAARTAPRCLKPL